MKILIKELLEYFDIKENSMYGDTTALISAVGEDLNAAIFKHYLESKKGVVVEIYDPNKIIPTQLKKIGRRLDRWIYEKKSGGNILYQTEIKNWCARAIGGVNVSISSNAKDLNELSEINWLHYLPELTDKKQNGINKVLCNMINDKFLNISEPYKKEPLEILWHVSKPKNENSFFFKFKLQTKHFYYDYVWIFSCSLYLRHLMKNGDKFIQLQLPNVERRLAQLNRLFRS